jgi:hypothetical protein
MEKKRFCPRFDFCLFSQDGCSNGNWLGCDIYLYIRDNCRKLLKKIAVILRKRDSFKQIGFYTYDEKWYQKFIKEMDQKRFAPAERKILEGEINLEIKEFLVQRKKQYGEGGS